MSEDEKKTTATIEFGINDEEVRAAFHAAVYNAIGDAGRKRLYDETVKYLTTPISSYGHGPEKATPIQIEMFKIVRESAEAIVRKEFENDTALQEAIKQLYAEAVYKVFTDADARKKLVDRIAEAVGGALVGARY